MKRWLASLIIMLVWSSASAGVTSTDTKTVTVNTNAADFTVVAAVTNRSIKITHLDAQNVGTTNKITVQFCDGPCGSATSKIGPFELSAATASVQGGGWTFACSGPNCEWNITPGNALVGQVDTGATNNVVVHVTYQYFQR